jgi:hypothetical protein
MPIPVVAKDRERDGDYPSHEGPETVPAIRDLSINREVSSNGVVWKSWASIREGPGSDPFLHHGRILDASAIHG